MNRFILITLLMFILTACNERTVYTLKTNDDKTNAIKEISQLLDMLAIEKKTKIKQGDKSIKISFQTKISDEDKVILDRVFSNSIEKNNKLKLDKLTLTVIDNNKEKLADYLRISNNKKVFEMIKKDKIRAQILYPQSIQLKGKTSCNLEVAMSADIPPLQVNFFKSSLKTKRLHSTLKEDDSMIRYLLDYEVVLNEKITLDNVTFESIQMGTANDEPFYMSNLYFNYGDMAVDITNLFINRKLSRKHKKLYRQCGKTILSSVTKETQNLFITPKLSQMVVSYERHDTNF